MALSLSVSRGRNTRLIECDIQRFLLEIFFRLVCSFYLQSSTRFEVQPQDTTHLIQRPCYQQGSPCQDPAGDRATRRPLDHLKETQTAVVWTCRPFIRSGQNHLARHSERGKKTRQTEEEVGRQHQGLDRPGVRQVPEGRGEQRKMRKLVVKSPVVPNDPRG